MVLYRFLFAVLFIAFYISWPNTALRKHSFAETFLSTIQKENIGSSQIIQIWLSCHQRALPIGGHDKAYHLWQQATEKILSTAADKKIKIELLLIVDAPVMQAQEHLKKKWDKAYPACVQWLLVDDILADPQIPSEVRSFIDQQNKYGVPAICSDYLRLWALAHSKSDLSIYTDIDSFVQMYHGTKNGADAYGLMNLSPGLKHSYTVQPFGCSWNNDVLVQYQDHDSIKKVVKIAEHNIKNHYYLYNQLLLPENLNHLISAGLYESYIADKAAAYQQFYNDKNLNRYFLIFSRDGIGPNFVRAMSLRDLSHPYQKKKDVAIHNDFSWQSSSQADYHALSYADLESDYLPDRALFLLGTYLMIEDCLSLAKTHPEQAAALYQLITERLNSSPFLLQGLSVFYKDVAHLIKELQRKFAAELF